jgi:hypothetical protein
MGDEVIPLGDKQVRIFVPSRRKDGGVVSPELRKEWDSEARSLLEEIYQGVTPSYVHGSYQDDGRTTREEITVLSSSCTQEALKDKATRERLYKFAASMCQGLGQDTIFFGWGDESFIIKRDFEYGDVPVIRFTELSKESQIVHLTLGWAGIDSPEKILQVLSLDGWTLPDGSGKALPSWNLCGVLHADGVRRAWAWTGSETDSLNEAIRDAGDGGPKTGDLIFMRGRDRYLEFGMVAGLRLVGPRDLRLSHGQLNPVTRHLLFSILRRDWNGLKIDLKRKPLDKRFFPELQKLRARVEAEFLRQPKAKCGKRNKGAEKAAEDRAFRESVLVVGRMMFIRFLIQKGWIPGGSEVLGSQAEKLGDDFFSSWIMPLWFDVLNQPEAARSQSIVAQFGDGYPYLNGGLFMPRPEERGAVLPGTLFQSTSEGSFLRLFQDFEFSLNEHDGSDDSLKVDPSFFGRALESFNPDVEKKRHGVHYTPKPVARALAAEAIVTRAAALARLPVENVRGLLSGGRAVTGREATKLQEVLGGLRIIDPAVGSGVLLWAALRVLLDLDSACDGVIGGRDGYQPGSYAWAVRSRHFVCNCLYGVDISDEAVELSRLRLWLAVALSEDKAAPLPDLELNVCRGDSLLGERPSGNGVTQMKLGYDELGRLERELRIKTGSYVSAGTESPQEQRQLRSEIQDIRRQLSQLGDNSMEEPEFNWEMFFPHVFGDEEKRGFDVVIANPPYVRVQKVDKTLLTSYRNKWATIAEGSPDLSFAFIELAVKKLAAPQGGQLAFVQPNFRHHEAGDAVRRLLTGHDDATPVRTRLWVDFDDAQVFPTATNYVALLFAERSERETFEETFAYSVPLQGSWEDPDDSTDVSWIRPSGRTHENPTDGEWLTVEWELRSRVTGSIATAKARLGDVAQIDVGVQTSADKVYLFESGSDCKDGTIEVFKENEQTGICLEAGILKRCVKGSAGGGYWLLFPYDAEGRLLEASEIAGRFPLAMKYLKKHRNQLEGRENDAFRGAGWYRYGRTQGCVVSQMPKVVIPAMLKGPTAIVDDSGELAFTASGKGGGGAWGVTLRPNAQITLEELAAALARDCVWDFYRAYGSPQKGGWRGIDKGVLNAVPLEWS